MTHKPLCPSLEVLSTRFSAHEKLVEERLVNDRERRANLGEELKKQAREYERRMSDLNHAHSLAEEKNREYISRDLHSASIRELTQKLDQTVSTNTQKLDQIVTTLTQKHDQAIATMTQKHDQAVATLTLNINALQKLVYIGLGIVMAINFVAIYIFKGAS